ncbi:signal peptidase I [Alicyclobacillaceae bacterium I2511]|jgi:signal peptidase I|nr:signal peptidase I [Alicyclobacillaceae bacterium I2511]
MWSWLWPIVVGVLIAKALTTWVFGFAYVPSSSMYPTIPNPCRILVDHVATEVQKPHEGEVVLFHWPDDPSQIFVKRVIGLPGDTVYIHGGHVYVNNKELSEPYLQEKNNAYWQPYIHGTWGPYHVPAGHYFMLGDNRPVSDDSRDWTHKYVPLDYIVGRADMVVWPLSKFSVIQQ